MHKLRTSCLLAVSLMMSACSHFGKPSTPPMQPSKVPPLDSYLAAPCAEIPEFPGGDYDALQLWVQEQLIPAPR